MTRTTPPRRVDIAEVLPQLAPLARPAVRLHPRPGDRLKLRTTTKAMSEEETGRVVTLRVITAMIRD